MTSAVPCRLGNASPVGVIALTPQRMVVAPFPNNDQHDNIRRPLVLVVDDNEDNLQLLTQVIVLIGYSFIPALNGHTAILKAQNYQPELILLDMMLPDLNGVEVVRRLKQDPQTRLIPVIAVTAMARAEDREQFFSAGCSDYIKKPYIIDEIEAKIRLYL